MGAIQGSAVKQGAIVVATVLVLVGCSSPVPTAPVGPRQTCHASSDGRPDPICTPGAFNPAVSQDAIAATICRRGWTATVRPPLSYTEPLKRKQVIAYGYVDHKLGDYEEDHLVPLELGGAPRDPRNLWPEPRAGTRGSATKDATENSLHARVCAHILTLTQAQAVLMALWGPSTASSTSVGNAVH